MGAVSVYLCKKKRGRRLVGYGADREAEATGQFLVHADAIGIAIAIAICARDI